MIVSASRYRDYQTNVREGKRRAELARRFRLRAEIATELALADAGKHIRAGSPPSLLVAPLEAVSMLRALREDDRTLTAKLSKAKRRLAQSEPCPQAETRIAA